MALIADATVRALRKLARFTEIKSFSAAEFANLLMGSAYFL